MKAKNRNSELWSESGQNILELALLTPMLLALLLGAIEVGRYAYLSILVGNAARAGAGYGAQSLPQSVDSLGINNAAQSDFQQYTGESGLTITSSTSCGCESGGNMPPATGGSCSTSAEIACTATQQWRVTVTVTATGAFNSIFIPSGSSVFGIPGSITVTRNATMVVANN